MMLLAGLLDEQTEPPPVIVETGLSRLDEVTGGLRGGQVWIVTGHPGQGMSLLLLQIALRSALAWCQTELYVPRQTRHDLKHRIVAHLGKKSVKDAVREVSEEELRFASSLPLRLAVGDRAGSVWDAATNEIMVVDDADLILTGEDVRRMCRPSRTIVLGLPYDEVVEGADLRQSWGRLADVILQVDTGGQSWEAESERSVIRMLKHRWGPRGEQLVWFEPFFARFRDTAGE